MLLSIQTDIVSEKALTKKETIKAIKDAGFDAYDISLFELFGDESTEFGADYQSVAENLRSYADSIGIVCNQSHAPFPSSVGNEERDAVIFEKIVKSMEIASILGAKIIVVHPKQHLCYAEHKDELFRMNVEFYRLLIPYAEKYNIKIATENMWQRNCGAGVPTDSVCSRAYEFNALIDAVNSPYLVGCLDIGHVSLMGADIPAFIGAMGNKRLQALHVHDTDFTRDLHTSPFIGKIDYEAVAAALGEIDYKGDFTLESGEFTRKLPRAMLLSGLRFEHDASRYLMDIIEKNRK